MTQESTTQIITLIQKYLGALANRDLSILTDFFSSAIDWDIPGNKNSAPWLGKRNSKAELKDFFVELWAETEPISANVEHIFVD